MSSIPLMPKGCSRLRQAAVAMAPLLAVVLAGAPGTVAAQDGIRLPDIGDSSGAVVSQRAEEEYGEALMREFRRLAQVVEDPIVEDYIRHLGYSLVAVSDQPMRQFHFFVVDDNNVNAFAAPGGYIGIHSELMLTADTEDEVAAVMAHEVAHVTQRHIARAVESAQKVSLPMTLLMLGAMIAGAGDGDAIQTAVVGTQALMAQLQINFTRENEYEADRIGIQTLARAGYDPEGMSTFFGKMARLTRGLGDQIPEFLRTHPVETTRIAEAKNRAGSVVVAKRDHDPEKFLLVRERVRVLTHKRPRELVAYYKGTDLDELHEAYGLALTHLRLDDGVAATEAFDPWRDRADDNLQLSLLFAEIALASDGASDKFEELHERYPANRAVARRFAELLLEDSAADSPRRAERLLRPLLLRYPDDALLHRIYSQAADRSGQPIRAAEAFAQHVYLQGRVYDAVAQLRTLVDTPGLTYYERSRIEARLAELEPILAEIERENGYDPSEGRRDRERRRLTFHAGSGNSAAMR